MGFFDFLSGNSEDKAAREANLQRQQASQASLESGGLPLGAIERLRHQRASQSLPSHLWTSDLSVSELSLVREQGYEPLGQVMGASIYHVGFQWRGWGWNSNWWYSAQSFELDVLSTAFSHARQLALGRLQQEAQLLGADGVVGVQLQRKSTDWSGDSVEFQAIGTAIRESGAPPRENNLPFLCALSGQDYWKLRQSGVVPVGLVAGNCTYYCIPSYNTQNTMNGGFFGMGSWQNIELPDFTQSLFTARELALNRLTAQSLQLQAHGTVGMTIEYDTEPHEVEANKRTRVDMIYHFLALGTAVRVEQQQPETATSRVLSLGIMPVRRASEADPTL